MDWMEGGSRRRFDSVVFDIDLCRRQGHESCQDAGYLQHSSGVQGQLAIDKLRGWLDAEESADGLLVLQSCYSLPSTMSVWLGVPTASRR
jgi:hypothetical protein